MVYDTWGEVFMKTLGFYCALQDHGCSFSSLHPECLDEDPDSDSESQIVNPMPDNLVLVKKDCRSPCKNQKCRGELIICSDIYGHLFIR